MFRPFRENLALKLISLAASIVMWLYVTADRYPNTITTRTVMAEPVKSGLAPSDVVVRLRTDPMPVEITGPKVSVDRIKDGEIIAEADLRTARLGTNQLKIARYKLPATAVDIDVKGRMYIGADILPRGRKSFPVEPLINQQMGNSARYGAPRLSAEWVAITGAQDDIKRISKLVINIDVNGAAVNMDLPVRPLDKDGLEVSGVDVTPGTIHVDMTAPEALSSRVLPVNVPHKITTAPNFVVSDIQIEPSQITVMGKTQVLSQMSNVSTPEVVVEGLRNDFEKTVNVVMPIGITTSDGKIAVRVRFKVREISGTTPNPN